MYEEKQSFYQEWNENNADNSKKVKDSDDQKFSIFFFSLNDFDTLNINAPVFDCYHTLISNDCFTNSNLEIAKEMFG